MKTHYAFVGLLSLCFSPAPPAFAQTADALTIDWKVENRFRFFRNQSDFDRHAALHEQGAAFRSILEVEHDLMAQNPDGKGWARGLRPRNGADLGGVCAHADSGLIDDNCLRVSADDAKGRKERYLNPVNHLVKFRAKMPASFGSAQCTWSFDKTTLPARPCSDEVLQRIDAKKDVSSHSRLPFATNVSVTAKRTDGQSLTATRPVQVRDVLIVGMGDSLASGEGNPDRPVTLTNQGYCYRRLGLGNNQYFRPSRANLKVAHACPQGGPPQGDEVPDDFASFEKARADWLFRKCHRSIYGYQMRTALAYAVKHAQSAVTYLPLGCTGATIQEGVLHSKPAREMPLKNGVMTSGTVEAQTNTLKTYLFAKGKLIRPVDAILLTIGANDVGFSELVSHVLLPEDSTEYKALKLAKAVLKPEDAQKKLDTLPKDFEALRQALNPFVSANYSRIVYVPYGNPAQTASGSACPTSRHGFDIHPAFEVGGNKAQAAVDFVENKMIPGLKKMALCEQGPGCATPAPVAMRFVEAHRPVLMQHGFCAHAASDPDFDKSCFKAGGDSFRPTPDGVAMNDPLTCGTSASAFQPFVPRARWQRTANDAYFAATTYPSSAALKPTDLHDALWAAYSAVYGGAIHPTSEGHAAMADAALPHLEEAVASR